jgi:glycosyl-4,4'-diaponeurosporenoate acyltransferase
MDNQHLAISGHSTGAGAGNRHLLDFWFRPRRFETERFYVLLGARLLKRYVPTGGDLAMRWLRRRHPDARLLRAANLESLCRFELWTRVAEAIHLAGFMGFAALAGWRFTHRSLSGTGLGAALVLDLAFGLWPVTLQRYNRLRVIRVIETATRISPDGRPNRRRMGPRAEPARARDEPACQPPSASLWPQQRGIQTGER